MKEEQFKEIKGYLFIILVYCGIILGILISRLI